MKTVKDLLIKVRFEFPPIPIRCYDYCAYVDGIEEDGRLCGYGETPGLALAELAERMQDYE